MEHLRENESNDNGEQVDSSRVNREFLDDLEAMIREEAARAELQHSVSRWGIRTGSQQSTSLPGGRTFAAEHITTPFVSAANDTSATARESLSLRPQRITGRYEGVSGMNIDDEMVGESYEQQGGRYGSEISRGAGQPYEVGRDSARKSDTGFNQFNSTQVERTPEDLRSAIASQMAHSVHTSEHFPTGQLPLPFFNPATVLGGTGEATHLGDNITQNDSATASATARQERSHESHLARVRAFTQNQRRTAVSKPVIKAIHSGLGRSAIGGKMWAEGTGASSINRALRRSDSLFQWSDIQEAANRAAGRAAQHRLEASQSRDELTAAQSAGQPAARQSQLRAAVRTAVVKEREERTKAAEFEQQVSLSKEHNARVKAMWKQTGHDGGKAVRKKPGDGRHGRGGGMGGGMGGGVSA